MDLTRNNYYSLVAEREFMSRSQYLGFLSCEARQMAILAGEWVEEPSEAFLVGQYIHAWAEGTRKEFIAEHPEMFTRSGELRAEFRQADKMIEAIQNDPMAMYVLEGQKEVIFTAEFAGTIWKVKLDVYTPERRRIVDLKSTRSIWEKRWSQEHGCRVSFVEEYCYLLQAALYCEIERRAHGRPEYDWFDFYVLAVSKEPVPDKEIISLHDPERYMQELEQVKENMPRILKVKAGEIEPKRCGRCDYCRATKRIQRAIHYSELELA